MIPGHPQIPNSIEAQVSYVKWHMLSHSVMSDSCYLSGTVACQTPLSIEFSRQEYWSELPCPPPGDLPEPGIEPVSPTLQADSLPAEPSGNPISNLEMI